MIAYQPDAAPPVKAGADMIRVRLYGEPFEVGLRCHASVISYPTFVDIAHG